jgi:hypothetical protein
VVKQANMSYPTIVIDRDSNKIRHIGYEHQFQVQQVDVDPFLNVSASLHSSNFTDAMKIANDASVVFTGIVGISTDVVDGSAELFVNGHMSAGSIEAQTIEATTGFIGPGDQITHLMPSQIPNLAAAGAYKGLQLLYTFDQDANGTNAIIDRSGEDNTGTILGTPENAEILTNTANDTDNIYKFAVQLKLSNANNGVSLSNQLPSLGALSPQITISIWHMATDFNTTNFGNDNYLASFNNLYAHLVLQRQADDTARIGFLKNNVYATYATDLVIQKNVWYHYVLQISSNNNAYLYVDGIRRATITNTNFFSIGTYPLKFIGTPGSGQSRCARGQYGNIAVYDRILSVSEIRHIFNIDSRGVKQLTGWTNTITVSGNVVTNNVIYTENVTANVGIGTTNPATKFDVHASTNVETYEFPPSGMNAATTSITSSLYGNGPYTASASTVSTSPATIAYYAFDKSGTLSTNEWLSASSRYTTGTATATSPTVTTHTAGTYNGEWIQLNLPLGVTVKSFSIQARNTSTDRADPKDFALFGSTTGTTWTQIFTKINEIAFTNGEVKAYTVTNTNAYTYYRLAINKITSTTTTFCGIAELRLYGVPATVSTLRVLNDTVYLPYSKLGVGVASPAHAIDVSGNVNATTFSGNGASLTSLNAANIATGILSMDRIGATAITDGKICDLNAAKLTSGSLPMARIDANAITDGKICDLNAAKLTSGLLPMGRIDTNAITDVKINDLNAAKLTSGLLNMGRIDANAITSGKINDLDAAKLTGTLDMGRIAATAITDAKINDLNAAKLTSGFLNMDRINGNAITSGKINDLDAGKLTGTLDMGRIAANAITDGKICDLNAAKLTSGLLPMGRIGTNAITDGKISDLNAAKLTGTLDMGRIAATAITDAKINDLNAAKLTGTLDMGRIAATAITDAKINDLNAGKLTGTLTCNGSGLTNLNANQITSGTINNAYLPSSINQTSIYGTTVSGNGSGLTNLPLPSSSSANTANTIVSRDGNGSFNAGTIAAETRFVGNGSGLTNLPLPSSASTNTANTIVSRDGTGSFNAGTIAAETRFVGNGSGLTNLPLPSSASTNTASTIVSRDGTGSFNAGTIAAETKFVGNGSGLTNLNAASVSGILNVSSVTASTINTTGTFTKNGQRLWDTTTVPTITNSPDIYFNDFNSQAFFGNVGIGTNTPQRAYLHMYHFGDREFIRFDNVNHDMYMGIDGSGGYIGTYSDSAFRIKQNQTDVISIDANGATTITVSNPSQTFPPANMITNTTSLSGTGYSGNFTASGSSALSSIYYTAFNNTASPQTWTSGTFYNTTTGAYGNGGATTTNGYSGEYIQLQIPVSVRISAYSIKNNVITSGRFDPKSFRLFGSTNGTTWIQLDERINQIFTAGEQKTYNLTLTAYYSYYRIAINSGTYVVGTGTNPNTNQGIVIDYISFTGIIQKTGLTVSGDILCTGDITAFGTVSDARLKQNVNNLDNALPYIRTLRPVNFQWKDDIHYASMRGRNDVGFIAQEVDDVLPLIIRRFNLPNENESTMGIAYEKMSPYIVKAIQEMDEMYSQKLDEMQKRIEYLESKLNN